MKRKILAAFAVLSLPCAAAFSEPNFSSDLPQDPVTFLVEPMRDVPLGEHLEYEVFWMGVPVGLGELWVKERVQISGKDAIHIVAVARTNDFLSKIYPVRDEVHSWVDAENLTSLQFQKKVQEGRYHADEKVVYDTDAKKGHYESLSNGSKKEFNISLPVQDIVSAFYWARRQPLQPGKSFKTKVNSDEKDWDLEIAVLRREKRDLRGHGALDTLVIEPKTRLKGVLEKRGRVFIHLKNDSSHTPVRVTFNTPYGVIVGVLKKSS